jgi:hypothetical protein
MHLVLSNIIGPKKVLTKLDHDWFPTKQHKERNYPNWLRVIAKCGTKDWFHWKQIIHVNWFCIVVVRPQTNSPLGSLATRATKFLFVTFDPEQHGSEPPTFFGSNPVRGEGMMASRSQGDRSHHREIEATSRLVWSERRVGPVGRDGGSVARWTAAVVVGLWGRWMKDAPVSEP